MTLIFLIGATMLLKDIVGTGVIYFLAKGRRWLAGVCDALGDIAAVFSYGVGGVSIYHHGLTMWSVWAVLSMSLGSLTGTVIGFELSRRLDAATKGTS